MKLASMNPEVERAVVIVKELSKDEQARFIAERDEKIRRDIVSGRNFAFSQGISQGLQQGLQQGISQGLQQGISQGLQQGVEKGRLEGIQEGVAQGLQQGMHEAHAGILKLINEGLTAEQIRERLSGFAE